MEIGVSIDRITIVAVNVNIEKYLGEDPYVEQRGMSHNYGFRYSYQGQKGELIEVGPEKVRIDYNPNKCTQKEIEKMLSHVKYAYFTRIDVAVDYFGVDFEKFDWMSKTRRKRNEWISENNALETIYIGAPSSSKRFRIYDKRKERMDAEEAVDKRAADGHWRVEVQQRYKESDLLFEGHEYLDKELFDIVPVRKKLDLSSIEKVTDRLLIAGLLAYPEEMNNVSKNSKTKYNAMIKEVKEKNIRNDIPLPNQIFAKKKELLVGELEALLNKTQKRLGENTEIQLKA